MVVYFLSRASSDLVREERQGVALRGEGNGKRITRGRRGSREKEEKRRGRGGWEERREGERWVGGASKIGRAARGGRSKWWGKEGGDETCTRRRMRMT